MCLCRQVYICRCIRFARTPSPHVCTHVSVRLHGLYVHVCMYLRRCVLVKCRSMFECACACLFWSMVAYSLHSISPNHAIVHLFSSYGYSEKLIIIIIRVIIIITTIGTTLIYMRPELSDRSQGLHTELNARTPSTS